MTYLSNTALGLYVDDIDILHYYFGPFETGRKYHSPFRRDPNPSFNIIATPGGKVMWKDFGLMEEVETDGIEFVRVFYDLDTREQAYNVIWNDMIYKGGYLDLVRGDTEVSITNNRKEYRYEKGDMKDYELKYWYDFFVSKKTLKHLNIYGCRGFYSNDKLLWKSTEDDPCFVYVNKEDESIFKVYKPLGPSYQKFRGINNTKWIEGYDQLPEKSHSLIITKSMKDTALFRSLGYAACNPSSENSYTALISKKDEINERFDNVIVWYDNDEPGVKASEMIVEKVGFKWIPTRLPLSWGYKDPTDLCMYEREEGLKKVYNILNHLNVKKAFRNEKTRTYHITPWFDIWTEEGETSIQI